MRRTSFLLLLFSFTSIASFQIKFFKKFESLHKEKEYVYLDKATSNVNKTCERPSSYPVSSTEQLLADTKFVSTLKMPTLDSLTILDSYNSTSNDGDEINTSKLLASKTFFRPNITPKMLAAMEKAARRRDRHSRRGDYNNYDYASNYSVPEGEVYDADEADTSKGHGVRGKMVNFSKKFLKLHYRWGGTTPNGFDCSGFTRYVYGNAAGIDLPRTSMEQSSVGKTVSAREAKPGDLIFFGYKKRGSYRTKHTGMVVANENGRLKVIHSSRRGIMVDEDILNSDYYKRKFLFIKRVMN